MKRILLPVFAALLLTAAACAGTDDPAAQEGGTPVYFLAPTNTVQGSDALQCSFEQLSLPENATLTEIAAAVAQRLLAGSQDGTLYSPFPEDVTLISLTVRDKRAHVDLSGSFSRLDGIALTLADYCLTLSLTAIDGIESVYITSEGRTLAQQPRQIFRERDIILSTRDSSVQYVEVSLYFLDETGQLTAEERVLEIHEGDTQSAVLVAALLDGPQSSALAPVIPADFLVSSIKVEDGVCRVNLPAPSLAALPADERTQELILRSLTQSLYSLGHIQEIRFLTDGTELEKFGSVSVSGITERQRVSYSQPT